LLEENLRGYVLLLSAHFQGFCRDLYTEASQAITAEIRATLRSTIQEQFAAHRHLDRGNPTLENLQQDFGRFGLRLRSTLTADPTNVTRLDHLTALNKWRNVAAHQGTTPPVGIALDLPNLQVWRSACAGLATALDQIVYNHLRRLLRRSPW